MQPEATLKLKVSITELPTSIDTEAMKEPDKTLGVLAFYNMPRSGEHFAHRDEDGVISGYTVLNVYHFTAQADMDDGAIGMIQVVKTGEAPAT